MKKLFKESTTQIFSKIKKGFLWTAVCLLIGGFAIGAILILADAFTAEMGKLLGTMAVIALVLFVGVNNFTRMEKGNLPIQILALVGLISGIFAAIIGILLIWEVTPLYESSRCLFGNYCYDYQMSTATKFLSVFSSLAAAGFWISNVLSIEETIKVVKPLKITSVVCETYCSIFAVVIVFISSRDVPTNLSLLSSLASFAFIVTALAALIISKSNKNKKVENTAAPITEPTAAPAAMPAAPTTNPAPKTDDELRAEIEEQVRREMIEKEVRARMEKEAAESKESEGQDADQ